MHLRACTHKKSLVLIQYYISFFKVSEQEILLKLE